MPSKVVLPLVLLLAFSTTSSFAFEEDQDDRGSYEEQQACTPDVFRLCSAYIPDVSNIINCLKDKKRSLSVACKTVMDRRNNMVRRVRNGS